MTRRPFFACITALTLAGLVTGLAAAQPGPPQGPRPPQPPQMAAPPPAGPQPAGPPLPQGPQLTDEQRTTLQELANEQRDRLQAARDQTRKLQEQLRAALWADKPDEVKIEQLRGDLARVRQEAFAARLDFQTRRALVFTPEQRRQMRDLQVQRQLRLRRGVAGPWRGGPGARGFRGRMRGFRGAGPWGGPGMGWWGPGLRRPLPPGPALGPGWRWWEDEP